MARKLRVYQTSQGFFDLAIAVPSMKAALEAWGANSNLFHQGFAQESTEAKTIAAAMEKPGVVLKRPVGTKGTFKEDAELPSDLDLVQRPRKLGPPAKTKEALTARAAPNIRNKAGEKKAKATARAFEKAESQRQAERRKRETAEAKDRKRREKAVEKAQAAFEKAEQEHKARAMTLEDERAKLAKRVKVEDSRWEKERERLQDAIRKAGV